MAIPEVIGLPLDGHWNHNAAYDHRYCFQHGEDEYLLSTPASWMSLTDFRLSAAGERLEVMLEQFDQSPSIFRPHSRRHQAECTSRLWSHVDSVTERTPGHGQVLYLIRWKACWTPRSCIDDIDWLGASLRKNQNPRCQRSSRLERTAEVRTRKNEDYSGPQSPKASPNRFLTKPFAIHPPPNTSRSKHVQNKRSLHQSTRYILLYKLLPLLPQLTSSSSPAQLSKSHRPPNPSADLFLALTPLTPRSSKWLPRPPSSKLTTTAT